ncbi:MAG: DUF1592 domain-containing protein [Myxococcales bacterium]|nr:DUF1592 domain-containing protein [Polyangiaceae bacterium]MDW8251662.1 DUF1592 domain-containing protein [Myxococcales bacterium]
MVDVPKKDPTKYDRSSTDHPSEKRPLYLGRLLPGILLGALLWGTGCGEDHPSRRQQEGQPGGAGGTEPDNAPPRFTCDPSQRGEEVPLRRLSRVQYQNALKDLLEFALPGQSAELLAQVEGELNKIPKDERKGLPNETHGGYQRLDQSVQQGHVDGAYRVAIRLGAELAKGDRLQKVVGSCARDEDPTNDKSCIEQFIVRVGERALRRPLDKSDREFFWTVYDAEGIDEAGVADVLGAFLTAPEFLYHVEHGGEAVPGEQDVFRLTAWELASRLSFHFWQAPPDDELRKVARDGSLLQDKVYQEQVERLTKDLRFREALDQFFAEWLWLDDLKEMDGLVGTAVYDAFANGFKPGADLREHMVAEITDLGAYYTLTSPGKFEDLLTSRLSFARTEDLASIYKVKPWDGKGKPPLFSEEAQVGLLTRAAFLATGTANTRPVMKGVFLRKGLLCDKVPPPPNNAAAMPPQLSPDFTTWEVVESITEQEGTACALCHRNSINPLGFATENFDALGRFRSEQRLFDAQGKLIKSKPVNTQSIPQVNLGDMTPSEGAADLTRMLVESGRPQACFVRNYFRFTFGRLEDLTKDGCILEELRGSIEQGAPLREVLARIALTRSFRERLFSSKEGK